MEPYRAPGIRLDEKSIGVSSGFVAGNLIVLCIDMAVMEGTEAAVCAASSQVAGSKFLPGPQSKALFAGLFVSAEPIGRP
jgi:hypothetical protein